MKHTWHLIFGNNIDSIYQCRNCGLVKHNYECKGVTSYYSYHQLIVKQDIPNHEECIDVQNYIDACSTYAQKEYLKRHAETGGRPWA